MNGPRTEHAVRLAGVLGEQLRSRRAFLAHLAKGMVGLGAALAGRPPPAEAQAIRRGGELRAAWLDSVDTLDPHFTSSLGAIKIQEYVYNGLLKVEFDGRRVSFVPDLVEKWRMPDPVTIARFKVFKALGPTVKGFRYLPADSMRFHTVHLEP